MMTRFALQSTAHVACQLWRRYGVRRRAFQGDARAAADKLAVQLTGQRDVARRSANHRDKGPVHADPTAVGRGAGATDADTAFGEVIDGAEDTI